MDSTSKQIVKGTYYTAIAKYCSIIISLIVTAILARFVSPSDFGVVAIATVFIFLFYLIGDMGVGTAIIQRKDLSLDDINNLFSFSVYLAIILAVVFALISPLISLFYDSSSLNIILLLLVIQVFFSTTNMVPNALLLKRKEFKFISYRTICIQFIMGVISCIVAISGGGIYALLINPIVGSASIFFLNYKKVQILKFFTRPNKDAVHKIFNYSSYQFLFGLQNYIFRNIDKLLIGKYLNMMQLGYYEKSYRLMLMPVQNISNVITPVLQPILSEYQNDINIQSNYFNKVTKLLATIGFPLSIFVFFNAKEIILIVYGDNWVEAIVPFKILSLSVASQMLSSSFGAIYQATNNVKSQLYIGLINTIWSVSMILFGLLYFGTTIGVALMFTIAIIVETIYNWTYVFKYIYNKTVWEFFKIISKPILIAIVLGIELYFFNYFTKELSIIISFVVKSLVGITTVLFLINSLKLYDIRNLFFQFLYKK